jgi:hypothetical protein
MTMALLIRKANIHAGFRAMAFRKSTLEGAAKGADKASVTR